MGVTPVITPDQSVDALVAEFFDQTEDNLEIIADGMVEAIREDWPVDTGDSKRGLFSIIEDIGEGFRVSLHLSLIHI